ncbi:high frequency lysogenization protein HflD [Acidihalobacter prosperus]
MEKNVRNRTLALAAVFHCASAADELARTGKIEPADFEPFISSVLVRDAASLEAIYGGMENLRNGLKCLRLQLDPQTRTQATEVMRYAVSLLHLERRLAKRRQILDLLDQGIDKAERQASYFEITHENVVAGLAALYRETIGELGPPIIVHGEQIYLSNEAIASQIRVLLLAGIRAAVLWRQAGGTKFRLLFGRNVIIKEVDKLLGQ